MANIEIKLDKKAKVIVSETADIGGGVEPTGTIDITENGEYDVKTVATANVNVPSEQVPVYEGPYTIQQSGTIEIKDKKATQNIEVDIDAPMPLNYYYVSSGAVTTLINQQIMPSSCYLYNGQNTAYEPLSRIAVIDHWNKKGQDPTLTNLSSGQKYEYYTNGPVGYENYLMPAEEGQYYPNDIVLITSSGAEVLQYDSSEQTPYYIYQEYNYNEEQGDFYEPRYQALPNNGTPSLYYFTNKNEEMQRVYDQSLGESCYILQGQSSGQSAAIISIGFRLPIISGESEIITIPDVGTYTITKD